MIAWLKRLMRRSAASVPPMPTWAEIVAQMSKVDEPGFFYSRDRAKRCRVYRDGHGFYRYYFEEIQVCDEEEWAWMHETGQAAIPAWWEEMHVRGTSIYSGEAEAERAMRLEPVWLAEFAQQEEGERL